MIRLKQLEQFDVDRIYIDDRWVGYVGRHKGAPILLTRRGISESEKREIKIAVADRDAAGDPEQAAMLYDSERTINQVPDIGETNVDE